MRKATVKRAYELGTMHRNVFLDQLRKIREERGTIAEAAELTGYHAEYIEGLESGRINPTVSEIHQYVAALGAFVNYCIWSIA